MSATPLLQIDKAAKACYSMQYNDINDRVQRKMSALRRMVAGLPAAWTHTDPMGAGGFHPPYAYLASNIYTRVVTGNKLVGFPVLDYCR
jgi:hypothetical protein